MKEIRIKSLMVVMMAVVVLAVSGCPGGGKKGPDVKKPEVEQVLRFSNGTEPETLDPGLMTGSPEFKISSQLFEGLIQNDPKTLKPIPAIAESWEISPDGRVYTFHLRKDVKWSNGDPVTANDFLYSWKRVLEPATGAEYAYQLYYVKNGKAYNTGEIKDFAQVGIKVVDDYTLVTELENATAYWLDLLAFHTLLPVNQKCVEEFQEKWTRAENIVTNGPFLLKEWTPKDRIVLEKNPDYYDAENVRLTKIIAYSMEDNVAALNMFKAGETDWIPTIPLTHIDEAKTWPETHITPFLSTYYYRFNVTDDVVGDVRVRKALNMAVDKQEICDYVIKAGQKPATTFVPPGIAGYNPPEGPGYDPDKARALMAEAGYGPGGKAFPELKLLYNTSEGHKKIAEAIKQMWKDELGMDVQLQNVEWKVYLKDLAALDYDISRAGWIGDYTDPNTFLDMWVTDGGNNQTGWSNEEYDGLIQAAAEELNPEKRMEILSHAEDILINGAMPIMPIYYYVNVNVVKSYVKGMNYNLRDFHLMKYLYIEK